MKAEYKTTLRFDGLTRNKIRVLAEQTACGPTYSDVLRLGLDLLWALVMAHEEDGVTRVKLNTCRLVGFGEIELEYAGDVDEDFSEKK